MQKVPKASIVLVGNKKDLKDPSKKEEYPKIEEKLDIEKIVTDKVENFSDQKLEDLLLAVTKKEFTFIEIVGGVFGFLIGIIQQIINSI